MDDEAIALGAALFSARRLPRGAHLLEAGAHATELALVSEGCLREYFVLGREPSGVRASALGERTKAFVTEGQFTGSLADLISGEPSRAFIVAEEPSRLLVAPYPSLRALGERSAAWAAVGRAGLEALLRTKAEREWELLALDAAERYACFRARYPGLEARALAKHVASYLGITPVHLSRLRRRRREKPRSR